METVVSTQDSLTEKIVELVTTDAVQLPPLPEVAIKAREMMDSPNMNTRALGELLEQDGAVVAALLRLANSAAFGGLGRIDSLGAAVQRIGMKQVSVIVTGLSLKGHFDHPSPEKRELLQVLWDHSVTSAFAARAIAKQIDSDAEEAFLSGLLHDCGKVLVLKALDRIEEDGQAGVVGRDALIELMDRLHTELGYQVLTSWNLPTGVAEVARDHEIRSGEEGDTMLCVQAANVITRRLGFHLQPDEDISVVEHPVIEDLGLTDMAVATLMIDMEDHLEEMKGLF